MNFVGFLFPGVNGRLNCSCTGVCSGTDETICKANEVCYTAEILDTSSKNIRVQKGLFFKTFVDVSVFVIKIGIKYFLQNISSSVKLQ